MRATADRRQTPNLPALLTLGDGDVDSASRVSAKSGTAVEVPWHVYVVKERRGSFVAEYLGVYGACELPPS
jgi:hypothetical protein